MAAVMESYDPMSVHFLDNSAYDSYATTAEMLNVQPAYSYPEGMLA